MLKLQLYNVMLVSVIFLLSLVESNRFRFDYKYSRKAEGYLKFHRVPALFTSALMRCHAEGAVLASPLNEDLQKAMETLREANGDNCGIFTGIHATFSKGDYASVEGIPIARIPVTWAPNEPDNYKNSEDCTIMLQNGNLADVQCNDTYPYICYRKRTTIDAITPCGTVDKKYELDFRTGSCYKFHRVGLTWREAYMTCMAEGGHLAIINNAAEVQVIKDIFAKNPANTIDSPFKDVASIGFYDMGERIWFTVHGQSLSETYSIFADGEPNNNKGFDNGSFCGGVFRSGQLDDVWCIGGLMPFICEKKPDSLLTNS